MPPPDSPTNEGPEVGAASSEGSPIPGLSALYADSEPTPGLQPRIVSHLHREGLLGGEPDTAQAAAKSRSVRLQTPPVARAVQAVAALLIFAAGWGARGQVGAPAFSGPPGGTEDYMLLIWGEADSLDAAEAAVVAAEYEAWARALSERGVETTGNELAQDRTIVGESVGAEPATALGGYFLLSLPPGQDVTALIQDHPHLAYGGWIEVAPIVRRH